MNRYFLPTLLVMYCVTIMPSNSQEADIFQSDKLVKKWETAPVFEVPESVCYDPDSRIIYVSNINGKPTDKDGNGYIAMLSPGGDVLKGPWITGLHAPKGMGIYNGTLYVSDIDRVAEVDIKTKTITQFYDFPEANFLNDIAIDQMGAVYVSDMASTRIYRIFEGKSETWLDDEILSSPNGLCVEDDQLFIGCSKIARAGISDKSIVTWLEKTGGIDGLEATGDGRFLFSDWQGNVYLAGTDKKIEKILDTTPAGINAADIEYIPSLKLLLVPTFGDNRVMAYELK